MSRPASSSAPARTGSPPPSRSPRPAATSPCSRRPDRAGGAVATEELTLPGFRHDVFSAVYPAAAASPVFARWPLERHGLRWIHPRRCYAHPLPDGRAGGAAPATSSETAASLDALHPGDGAAWQAFARPYLRALRRRGATRCCAGFPPVRGPAAACSPRTGSAGTLDFAKLLLMPAQALAGAAVRARRLPRPGSTARRCTATSPPDGAGSAIAAAHLNLMGHAVGWPSPEGGAGRLADALVGLSGVARRPRPDRRAASRASRSSAGGSPASRSPAASACAATLDRRRRHARAALLRLAGDALDGRYAAALRAFRPGPATLKVDWALDGPIPWAAPEAREAGTVHVGGAEDEVLEALAPVGTRACTSGRSCCSASSRSPTPRARRRASTPPGPTRTARRTPTGPRETDRHVERMEAQVERFAPGFRDLDPRAPRPGPRRARAPRTRTSTGGDVGAGSYALDQVVFRPVAEPARPTARPCAGSTSAAPRRSRAAPCTASPATPRPGRSGRRPGPALWSVY